MNTVLNTCLAAVMTLSLVMLATGCDTKANEMKKDSVMKGIAVIDTHKIYRESAPSEAGRAHLQKVRESLEAGAKSLDAVYGDKGSHPSRPALENGVQRLNLQYQAEEQAVNKAIGDVLALTAREWLSEHPGTVVLPSAAAIAWQEDVNITDDILTRMKKKKATFGTVPAVSVTPPEAPAPEKKKDAPSGQKH
ncbi:hypothetical protein [Enterobacter sp. SORGH_AS_0287]|uniref:hypothetical protein n=1 Tax=Enterobacter sp. SORGH_AS_0287 TaxID=3041779 RepID=UPI0028627C7C|nr:hypothetical protein [Enterobacter sp. SORGH_AS_0287]MDR6366996.1 Skp family chaperone for outer membrane proteins [Enterobacter sp. SORGH_AS_0287]